MRKSPQSCPTVCNPMDYSPPGAMGFSRQEYLSGLPCPPPGMEPMSLLYLALAGGFFTTSTTWEVVCVWFLKRICYHYGCTGSSLLCRGPLLLQSTGLKCVGFGSCSVRAQLPRGMFDLGSPTRDRTHVPCFGRQVLNPWTSTEVPVVSIHSAQSPDWSLAAVPLW